MGSGASTAARCITPPSVHHVRSSKDENDKRSLLPVLDAISVSEWNVQYCYAIYLLDSDENAARCILYSVDADAITIVANHLFLMYVCFLCMPASCTQL